MQSPEELARENIDRLLTQCGWIIQKRSEINLSAGCGIAITEGLLKDEDARWQFGLPPRGKVNFAWVQHFIHHFAPHGNEALLCT
jgi:hypothetical protein